LPKAVRVKSFVLYSKGDTLVFSSDNEVAGFLSARADTLWKHFRSYSSLFLGEHWDMHDMEGCTAASNGQLYCYMESLRGLSDSLAHGSLIHAGSGSIQYGSRLYDNVFDEDTNSYAHEAAYPARNTNVVSDISVLWQDTTSPGLRLHGIVEENLDTLSFWYRVSSTHGATTVSPGKFLKDLEKALGYKADRKFKSDDADSLPALTGQSYILVEGEGRADKPDGHHLLLPMNSNTLGRCVAISRSPHPTALVRNHEELANLPGFGPLCKGKVALD
jgi:hypothetical protein